MSLAQATESYTYEGYVSAIYALASASKNSLFASIASTAYV